MRPDKVYRAFPEGYRESSCLLHTHTHTHGGGGCGVETTRDEGGLRDGIEVEREGEGDKAERRGARI